MKTTRPLNSAPSRRTQTRSEQGSTTVAVLAFLLLMAMLVFGNSQSLKALKQDLKRTEQIQLRKYRLPPGTNKVVLASLESATAVTNAPTPTVIQP